MQGIGGRSPSVICHHHNELSLKFDMEFFGFSSRMYLLKLEYTSGMNRHCPKTIYFWDEQTLSQCSIYVSCGLKLFNCKFENIVDCLHSVVIFGYLRFLVERQFGKSQILLVQGIQSWADKNGGQDCNVEFKPRTYLAVIALTHYY